MRDKNGSTFRGNPQLMEDTEGLLLEKEEGGKSKNKSKRKMPGDFLSNVQCRITKLQAQIPSNAVALRSFGLTVTAIDCRITNVECRIRERGRRKEQEPEYEHEYEKESRDINSDAG